jgi:hypothetical protein
MCRPPSGRQIGQGPDQELGARSRWERPRKGDQPLELAVRDPPRCAGARRARRLRQPIGGVLFADGAVVPYAIGVDVGCGVALVETDLTVETLSASELTATLEAIAAGVPVGMSGQPTAVDRDGALAEIGLDIPPSVESRWFDRAVNQLGTLGSWNQLPRAPSGTLVFESECRVLGLRRSTFVRP